MATRIGFSKDIHQLAPKQVLMLGGVNIPSPVGCIAHSDGDVLLHAIAEAILGALALGDLGTHFSDKNAAIKGMSSSIIIEHVLEKMTNRGYRIANVDTFISLEKPTLNTYIPIIQTNVAQLLGVEKDTVSIKVGTNEKMDAVGLGQAIEAYAIVLLEHI